VSFPPFAAIVTAAGSSERFQLPGSTKRMKKEFMLIDDRTVLYHAVEPFIDIPSLQAVIVTYPYGLHDETELALDNLMFAYGVPITLVEGGATRQESVLRALEQLESLQTTIEYVAIHDGARPWVDQQTIIDALATATVFGGAVPALTIHDAVKRIDTNGCLSEHVDRTRMVTVQTPQVFAFPRILMAHRQAAATNGRTYVDDTEVFTDFGGMVAVCQGSLENRKITTIEDLAGTSSDISKGGA